MFLDYLIFVHRCHHWYPFSADCRWGQWGNWGVCSGGNQLRFRSIEQEALNGGIGCSGASTERRGCVKGKKCSKPMMKTIHSIIFSADCRWGRWGEWGACSEKCGNGTQLRIRSIAQKHFYGGSGCSGYSSEQRDCNTHNCPTKGKSISNESDI